MRKWRTKENHPPHGGNDSQAKVSSARKHKSKSTREVCLLKNLFIVVWLSVCLFSLCIMCYVMCRKVLDETMSNERRMSTRKARERVRREWSVRTITMKIYSARICQVCEKLFSTLRCRGCLCLLLWRSFLISCRQQYAKGLSWGERQDCEYLRRKSFCPHPSRNLLLKFRWLQNHILKAFSSSSVFYMHDGSEFCRNWKNQ